MSGTWMNRIRAGTAAVACTIGVGAVMPAVGIASPPPAAPTSSVTTPWLMVSDVHFTPFLGATSDLIARLQAAPVSRWPALLAQTGTAPSPYGSDANAALVESSLAAMKAAEPAPPVVTVTGDLLAHDFQKSYTALAPTAGPRQYHAFVDKTIAYLAARFDATFPHAQFVLTLGNNDSYCGDYQATPDSAFLLRTARTWEPLVNRHSRAPGFVSSFRQLGSYVAKLPVRGLHVVSVDDVFWSADYANTCGSPTSDPSAAQAAWLQTTMRRLPRGDHAWLATHIPPGIDAYATLQGSGPPVPLLGAPGQAALLGALDAGQVPALLFGHLHMSTYRLARDTPMLGVPSISPIFGNDPAFLVATVRSDGTIGDYTAHALSLAAPGAAWQREYDFGDTYDLANFDAPSLAALQQELAANAGLRDGYEHFFVSGGQYPITEAQYPAYACASTQMAVAAFSACLGP